MARKRQEAQRETTIQDIKAAARRLMAEQGTAGLSVRAIGRELGMTAPALYHYYDSLDDLITALIADAFNSLGEHLENTQGECVGESHTTALTRVMLAYRQWAVDHPVDFQLIYGNPIPGFHAPREVTVPAVIRGFVVIVGLIEALLQSGEAVPRPPYDHVPETMQAVVNGMIEGDGYPVSPLALYMGLVGWTQLHGVIILELYNHLQPVVGDVGLYFREQVNNLLYTMGVTAFSD